MFKPVQNKRVYQQVTDQIQAMIMDGTLKSGDRLPAERELSEQFQISRASVREAIRALEILGLIECRQGGGNFICDEFNACLFEPLSLMFKLNNGSFSDVLEVRKMLETEAAMLASEKMTDSQRKELTKIMKQLTTAKNEAERIRFDAEFHFKIIEASGNYLIQSFYSAVASLMKSFIKQARKIIMDDGKRKELLQYHHDIFDAVTSGDREKVTASIDEHFKILTHESAISQAKVIDNTKK